MIGAADARHREGPALQRADRLDPVARREQKIEPRIGSMNRAHGLRFGCGHADDFRCGDVGDIQYEDDPLSKR